MFFSVILILLIAIVFRKQKMDETGQQKSDEIEYLSKNNYTKSNKNLWSSIILHAFTNAVIMALGTVFST